MNNQLTLPQQKAKTVALAIENLGYKVHSQDQNKITFYYNKAVITYYLSNDWVAGSTIKEGRGLNHLIEQIKYK